LFYLGHIKYRWMGWEYTMYSGCLHAAKVLLLLSARLVETRVRPQAVERQEETLARCTVKEVPTLRTSGNDFLFSLLRNYK
jgi:hypothetical protein